MPSPKPPGQSEPDPVGEASMFSVWRPQSSEIGPMSNVNREDAVRLHGSLKGLRLQNGLTRSQRLVPVSMAEALEGDLAAGPEASATGSEPPAHAPNINKILGFPWKSAKAEQGATASAPSRFEESGASSKADGLQEFVGTVAKAERFPSHPQGAAFGVSRLGILGASPPGSFSASSSSTQPGWQGPAAGAPTESTPREDRDEGVRYIHIPKHALREFRTFARDVAHEASREVASNNPYVVALRRHRKEMETPLVVVGQTREQQLGTEREALSVLRAADLPGGSGSAAAGPEVLGLCSGNDCQPRARGHPVQRCCFRGNSDLVCTEPTGRKDIVLAQLPVLQMVNPPCTGGSNDIPQPMLAAESRQNSCEGMPSLKEWILDAI